MLNCPGKPAMTFYGDGSTVERDAQIIAHGLHSLMIRAFEPWQNGVAREIVCPTFEGFRYFDAQLCCLMKNRRTGIRGENVRPELRPRKLAADVHHEIDGLATLFRAFAGEAKNNVERGDHTRSNAALGGLIDVTEDLEILVHQLHHGGGGGFNSLTDLMKSGAAQQGQLVNAETGRQIRGGLDTPLETGARPDQPLGDLQRPVEVDQKIVIRHP